MSPYRVPRYRMVALDVDGTLLGPDGHVSLRTAEAVRAALAAGVEVVLCTGRAFAVGIRELSEELGLSLPAIVRNGAAIQDTSTGTVLFQWSLPWTAVRAALDVMLASDVVPVVEEGPRHGEGLYTLAESRCTPAVFHFIREWLRNHHVRHLPVPDSLYAVREPAWLGGCGALEATRQVYGALRSLPGASATWSGDRRPRDEYHCTSIFPIGCSKAATLARFAAARGIALADVMAVGDYYNDVEMLAEVGWGVAMGHAPESVRAAARAIAPSNVEHGAAVAIEQYVFGRPLEIHVTGPEQTPAPSWTTDG